MNTNNFDAKDSIRIADILRKSKGSEAKAAQLATNMAKAITKADKALRRGRAAEDVNEHSLAAIFFARHRELAGPNVATGHDAEPEVEFEIVGVSYRKKEKDSAKPRIYFWDKTAAKSNVLEMMAQRWTPKQMFFPLMAEVLEPIGMAGVPVRWSQYAGCSCPCSPGFILDRASYQFDIHVDYEVKVKTAKSKAS